jgi:hypothetical protein
MSQGCLPRLPLGPGCHCIPKRCSKFIAGNDRQSWKYVLNPHVERIERVQLSCWLKFSTSVSTDCIPHSLLGNNSQVEIGIGQTISTNINHMLGSYWHASLLYVVTVLQLNEPTHSHSPCQASCQVPNNPNICSRSEPWRDRRGTPPWTIEVKTRVFPYMEVPNKWMVQKRENPTNMDGLSGKILLTWMVYKGKSY